MNAKVNQIAASMENALADLVSSTENSKLPEDLFVSNFLKFFIGIENADTNKEFLPTWISIAGSPSADVDVIDKSGNVLFVVPGFVDSAFINPTKRTGISYSDIVNMSILYGNNIPQQGAAVLKNELEQKVQRLKDKSPDYVKKIKMWETIFTRYSKYIKSTSNNTVSTSATVIKKNTSNLSDDDFE